MGLRVKALEGKKTRRVATGRVGAPKSTAWKPGQSGNPSGRPKGSKGKKTLRDEKVIAEAEAKGLTPMSYLLSVMINAREPRNVRIHCAVALLPYMHKKLPTDTNVTMKTPQELVAAVQEHVKAAMAQTK